MSRIWQATLWLVFSAYFTKSQVSPIISPTNNDFASGSFIFDLSKVYGNTSAPTTGTNITMAYPSDFVTSGSPFIITSLSRFGYYTNNITANIDLVVIRSMTSTSFTYYYVNSYPYFLKNLGYYYLLISLKYANTNYFYIVDQQYCKINQNITTSNAVGCNYAPYVAPTIPFPFNNAVPGGSLVCLTSVTGMSIKLYPGSNYSFGFTFRIRGINNGYLDLIASGTGSNPTFLGYVYYQFLLFNTSVQ